MRLPLSGKISSRFRKREPHLRRLQITACGHIRRQYIRRTSGTPCRPLGPSRLSPQNSQQLRCRTATRDRQTVRAPRRAFRSELSCAGHPAKHRCQTAVRPRHTGQIQGLSDLIVQPKVARPDGGLVSSPRRRHLYPRRSFKPHWLCRRLVTHLIKHCEIIIGQSQPPADPSQGIPHANPLLRPYRTFQNVADFRLGAAAVHRRPHAQSAMHLIRNIPYCQDGARRAALARRKSNRRAGIVPLNGTSRHRETSRAGIDFR
ncbi:hypothetical protein FB009_11425 [Sinorhizobium medicae]|nr:hypothetical protein FB009_11425 [Sinorhizobium medicae]